MRELLANLRPTYVAAKFEQLDRAALKDKRLSGVSAVVCDVDGTLMNHHATELEQPIENSLNALAYAGIKLYILSNAYGSRIDELHDIFGEYVVRIVTPVDVTPPGKNPKRYRKPNPAMLQSIIGGSDPRRYLVVGDQLFKDVLTANRVGALSLLVNPRGDHGHWGVEHIQRPVEQVILGCKLGQLPTALERVTSW